jgi:hypothetical protein
MNDELRATKLACEALSARNEELSVQVEELSVKYSELNAKYEEVIRQYAHTAKLLMQNQGEPVE